MNRDVPYCSRVEDFILLAGVAEGVRLLNEHGFKVVVVTNQSGIARGYFTEEMLAKIHDKMRVELAKKGARIDAIYHCPHHPDDNCICRKPNTGLFEQASRELDIDLQSSYVIGDKLQDMLAGRRVGCKTVLVPSSEPELRLLSQGGSDGAEIDSIHSEFHHAAKWVIAQMGE